MSCSTANIVRGTALALMLAVVAPTGLRAEEVSEAGARAIGVDAYLYFYPLVTMDITRRQLTNAPPGTSEIAAAPNTFANVPAFPSAEMRAVVRPNFDTLYSSAWLDLSDGPIVVSVPDTGGRYYLLPMLDMWTDVFASPGWRTTGTEAGHFLIVPPGWTSSAMEQQLPPGTQRISAPTPHVWIIGRVKTDGPSDYAAVHKVQAGFKLMPLSHWATQAPIAPAAVDPTVDLKTPPKVQVDTMTADEYFAYAADLLKTQPPHITDQPILARMSRLGIEPGKPFALASAPEAIRKALADAPSEAKKLMQWKVPTLARVANGWSMNTDTMGVYGNYYLKRAIIAQQGLGANLPDDAIYPLNLADNTGRPLDGANNYTLHFANGQLPPADAFWSVTLYDADGFPVENPLKRYALSSWMPLKTNADGSVELYFQHESPGADRESNWLPAPAGPFNLTMRLYAPKQEALTGKWDPPAVEREVTTR